MDSLYYYCAHYYTVYNYKSKQVPPLEHFTQKLLIKTVKKSFNTTTNTLYITNG